MKNYNMIGPNILLNEDFKKGSEDQKKRADIIQKHDKKINDMLDKIKQEIQSQKQQKKENKLKWEKENQSKTLKKLIEMPK